MQEIAQKDSLQEIAQKEITQTISFTPIPSKETSTKTQQAILVSPLFPRTAAMLGMTATLMVHSHDASAKLLSLAD